MNKVTQLNDQAKSFALWSKLSAQLLYELD